MRIDYEKHPSEHDSDTVVEIHADSDLLQDEDIKLADIAVEIKKKKKEYKAPEFNKLFLKLFDNRL